MTDRHHESQRRAIWPPSEGHFRMRLVRRGWAVPAMIRTIEGGLWQAIIDEIEHEPHANPAVALYVDRVWTSGEIIGADVYDGLIAFKRALAAAGEYDHPALNPHVPINPLKTRPL